MMCSASVPQRAGEAEGVEDEIEGADGDGARYQNCDGDVGIDDRVEVMHEEAAGVGGQAGAGFEVLFEQGDGAGPGADFDDDAPEERGEVEAGETGASAREECAEDDPEDPDKMDREDQGGEELHGSMLGERSRGRRRAWDNGWHRR